MFSFDFTVEGLTHEQADTLLKIILLYVESHGGEMGGGFGPTAAEDKGDEQTNPVSDRNQNPQ